MIPTPRIVVAEVVVPLSLRPTCVRSRHRRVATASAPASPPRCRSMRRHAAADLIGSWATRVRLVS